MLMIRWVYPPLSTRQKKENGFSFENWGSTNEKMGFVKIEFGLNGVGSNSNGLVLLENDATRLSSFLNRIFGLPRPNNIKKSPKV